MLLIFEILVNFFSVKWSKHSYYKWMILSSEERAGCNNQEIMLEIVENGSFVLYKIKINSTMYIHDLHSV